MKLAERVTLIPTTRSLAAFGTFKKYKPTMKERALIISMLLAVMLDGGAEYSEEDQRDDGRWYNLTKYNVQDRMTEHLRNNNIGIKIPEEFYIHIFPTVFAELQKDIESVGFKPNNLNYFNTVESPVYIGVTPKNWISVGHFILRDKNKTVSIFDYLKTLGRNSCLRELSRTFRRQLLLDVYRIQKELPHITQSVKIAAYLTKSLQGRI